jgi:hypothetical protein
VEQYLRDCKILSLYEGTNGIQSIDLMGRKMTVDDGASFRAFMSELHKFCEHNKENSSFGQEIRSLFEACEHLGMVATQMIETRKSDAALWGSQTYPLLLCFGDVSLIWRLLELALVAENRIRESGTNAFLRGKLIQAKFMTKTMLPLTRARLRTCLENGHEIMEMPEEGF